MKVIGNKVFFWGGYFSNWYKSIFTLNNVTYNCGEQALMHLKALLFKDYEIANKILRETDPKIQKQLGRKVKNFDESIWISNREHIMYEILIAKFEQNSILKKEILKYKDYQFVEASPYDTIWGIGLGENDSNITNTSKWKGLNLLGNTLTKVCNKLKEEN